MRYISCLLLAMLVLCCTSALADDIDEEANAAEARQWLSEAAARFAAGEHAGLPLYQAEVFEQLPPREEYLEMEGACSYVNCCAPLIDSRASSSLAASGGNAYGVEQLLDFDTASAWVEGVSGNGVGEGIRFGFRTHAADNPDGASYDSQYVNGLEIITGYTKSQALHLANACPVLLKVSFNGEAQCYVRLLDSMDIQQVYFEPLFLAGGTDPQLTIEIAEVREGKKYADAAITELAILGGPCH